VYVDKHCNFCSELGPFGTVLHATMDFLPVLRIIAPVRLHVPRLQDQVRVQPRGQEAAAYMLI
jgi:hypothetical protein